MDPSLEDAIYNERPVKVICIGAGASGLCLAYKLQRCFNKFSLTIYDKNPKVGGTWYENRYPGCACDVPSHNYVYSFEPKPDFSSVYAGSDEIQEYFASFVQKYNLAQYLQLAHMVERTSWNESQGQWEVESRNLETNEVTRDWCHILVHATGYLNTPAWPMIPGIDEYEGVKVHSAAYDRTIDLAGKDVLLIGAGSSAVQILPVIQPIVKSVTIFIRSPAWMLPDISSEAGQFTQEQIQRFVHEPETVTELRKTNERTMNSIFTMYLQGTVLQQQARSYLEAEMKKLLAGDDNKLEAHGNKYWERNLIPSYAVGCKRVIPSGFKYLKTLAQDNVHPVFSGVKSFTKNGVISDSGVHFMGDIAICATGFDTSYVPHYPVILGGPQGRNLQTEWAAEDSIMGYMGVGVSDFPNTFTMLGPYTPVSNGPTVIAIEAQADYICAFVDRYQTEESIHSFHLRRDVAADFKAHVASFMNKQAVWTDGCRNSHNNHKVGGRVPTTWPGSTLHYLEAVREVRWEDWEVKHRSGSNRFSWLGNGISQTEWDPTADLAYYIKEKDDTVLWNSRSGRLAAINKSGSLPPRALHRQAKLAAAEPSSSRVDAHRLS